MSMLQKKSKEFLDSITKIKKLAHKYKKSQEFHPGMLMTMKIIYSNCLSNKEDENYYGMKTSELTKYLCITKPATSKMLNVMEEKGYISSHIEKEGKMPEKSVYSLTEKGKQQFEKLMLEISCKPINIFLDFNAVIVNLDSMSRERQQECLDNIESSMEVLKKYLEENIALKKSKEDIPVTGMAVLRQQYTLAEAIEEWIASLKKEINS